MGARAFAFVVLIVLAAAAVGRARAFAPPVGSYDRLASVAAICTLGYARRHRRVPYRVRDEVYDRYGLPRGMRRGYVIDHLVPLELGGRNDLANLWPQKRSQAHRKDLDENRLHDEVCSGEISLPAARAEILRLWRKEAAYGPVERMRITWRPSRNFDPPGGLSLTIVPTGPGTDFS